MTDNTMTLGKKIYELRKLKRWKQSDLAVRSGMPRGHISRIECNDYRTWHLDTLMKLAKGFDIHPHILLQAIGYFEDKFTDISNCKLDMLSQEPDLQIFFTTDWAEMSQSEKELVRRVVQVAKQAKDQRLGKKP